MLKLRPLLQGLATYLPRPDRSARRVTGGAVGARYCYSVWLRHLTLAHRNGLPAHPRVLAELGPGRSLGIGLAGLLSGSDRYYAFDVVGFVATERNAQVFEELVTLFRQRAPIPGPDEFPRVRPALESYAFPSHVLSERRLADALHKDRLAALRTALRALNQPVDGTFEIAYTVPWSARDRIRPGTIDMLFSQAVLEHVDGLADAYAAMRTWLAPDGFMSHCIDFRCHETAHVWNGHWGYADLTWKLIRGRRPYLLNREPHSRHRALMEEHGFRVVCDLQDTNDGGLPRSRLAPRFGNLTDADLHTCLAVIQAVPAPERAS